MARDKDTRENFLAWYIQENLKAYGLFVPTFLTDTKKVWSILLACFVLSSVWQHVKKFASQ
jgi:hypothetical protein